MKNFTMRCAAAVSVATMLAIPVGAQQAPGGPIEILVGASPGGGYDRMARAIQTVAEG